MNNDKKGCLFIISAPSGAGKTSLVKRITGELSACRVSISHTTRNKRPGEVDGTDYFFVSAEVFQDMLKQQAFLEYAQVFDNFYGTSKSNIETLLAQGNNVILEIDWQGAQQVRALVPNSVSIFILPPSRDVLAQRLRSRGQDSENTITRRMLDAVNEMSHYDEYDYLIVNDQLELATKQLKSIIAGNGEQLPGKTSYVELIEKLLN